MASTSVRRAKVIWEDVARQFCAICRVALDWGVPVLNWVWLGLILISIVYGAFTGHMGDVSLAISDGAKAAFELVLGLVGGMVFMLGIAFTLKDKGHVRVDVLYERLPIKARISIDLLGHLLFLIPVSVFILWTSIDYVQFAWSLKETSSQPGGLPGVYLLKTIIPMMASLLLLQGLAEILKGLGKLFGTTSE